MRSGRRVEALNASPGLALTSGGKSNVKLARSAISHFPLTLLSAQAASLLQDFLVFGFHFNLINHR